MTVITKQFFIYARKSTESEERQVRSIGDQLAELREIARRDKLFVVDELVESQTAKMPGRPVFNEMLMRIEKGEAAGILAWHPDRLARNSVDGGKIIHMVDTKMIQDMRFSTFWFEPTPQGKFMLAIAFGQSKYYVDNLSENIRRGQRQKLLNGIWPQRAPLGYLNDRKNRCIVPDPQRADFIRQAFELYAPGDCTLDRLTATINGLGFTTLTNKPLARSQYHRTLRNPIYYGLIRYQEELYEGKHQPIITKKLFDEVQAVMQRRGKAKEPGFKAYPFRKMFHCAECGGFITTETQKGHHYLRCTKKKGPCSQRFLREEELCKQANSMLASIALPQECIDEMQTELMTEGRDSITSQQACRTTLHKAAAHADAKLKRLTAAYLEEALSLTEYRQLKNEVVEEKAALQERIKECNEAGENRLEPLTRFVKRLQEATLLASTENSVEKVKFLKTTGSNLTIQDRRIKLDFHEPWKTVKNHGRFAQPPKAAPPKGAASRGETNTIFTSAER
jgi:site-specific DNA recombinase